MRYWQYLWYIIRHKWFVIAACWKLRLYSAAITHDISKLLPSEFIPYADHFFGCNIGGTRGRFDFAWLLHQKRNKHHWQWWCLVDSTGELKVLEMPIKYRKEMLADWIGAGKAKGQPDIKKWYAANEHAMLLGIETREWLESQLKRGKR